MLPLVKYGLMAIFIGLLAVIGWLLRRNMQLKQQLAESNRFHDDPKRSAGRQSLVSAQETARTPPPYAAAPYDDERADEQAQTAPPHIVGDGDWEPDWPSSKGAQGTGATTPESWAEPGAEPPAEPPVEPRAEPRAEPALPRLTPQSTPTPATFAAPTPHLSPHLPLDQLQDLVRRAPDMAASEFRAAANALGRWFEVNVNGTGGTLHWGEEDGLPRPLIAILQEGNSAVVLPSAQYARDFAFQHYKIRNSEPLRAFFDLEVSSRIALAYAAPCLVTIDGQDLCVVQRGLLSGFSD